MAFWIVLAALAVIGVIGACVVVDGVRRDRHAP